MKQLLDALKRLFIFSVVNRRELFTNEMNFGNIGVTTNEIHYPSNIKCECGKEIEPTPKTIDSGTWDLLCGCGKIGYYHPKRDERQQQISDMLDW